MLMIRTFIGFWTLFFIRLQDQVNQLSHIVARVTSQLFHIFVSRVTALSYSSHPLPAAAC